MKKTTVIMVNLLSALLCCGTLAAGDLTHEFVHPPDSAKPWVFMFWFGKTTAVDVTRQMEELKAKGIKVRAEAGGQHHRRLLCSDGLMNQGRMDVPVGEFWENEFWKENQGSPVNNHTVALPGWDEEAQNVNVKQTASAAHLYGKPLVAAESFTSGGKRAAWGVAPADLLLYADIAFCEGVNATTIHGSITQAQTS